MIYSHVPLRWSSTSQQCNSDVVSHDVKRSAGKQTTIAAEGRSCVFSPVVPYSAPAMPHSSTFDQECTDPSTDRQTWMEPVCLIVEVHDSRHYLCRTPDGVNPLLHKLADATARGVGLSEFQKRPRTPLETCSCRLPR